MKNRKGFTLIEVIIAIVLISIIGLILGFSMNNIMKKNVDKEYIRFTDMVKSSASTYVTLNRDAIEELYGNKSYVYVTVDELIRSGLIDENLENPYTNEKINKDEVIKVNLDAVTGAIVMTYPIDGNSTEEVTLVAMADILDEDGVFNCMDGAGTYKLAISKEDGTLIHLANESGVLDGTIISKYDINCKIPTVFTETTGSKDAVVNGSTYRSYKNYKVKEGSFDVEYSWRAADGKIHKITRVVSVKGKLFEAKFDGNKGTPSVGYIKVMHDAPYGTLATASRSGYIFGGWYYSGNNILPETKVYATETHTLKAKWMKKPTITTQGYHKNGSTMNASNGYVYKDVATVTFNGPEDNDDTIYYYVYSGSKATTNVSAYSCGTASTPGNCSTNGSTTINANTWYKVGSATKAGETKVIISYENHNDSNVTLKTYVSNAANFRGAGAQATIKKIDRTQPANCAVVPTGTVGKNGYYVSNITFVASASDAQSGVKTKTVDIASITSDTKSTTVTATIEDIAGNVITCQSAYKRDVTGPKCYNDSYSNWTKNAKTITWGCGSDTTSGCVKKEYGKATYTTTTVNANVAAYTIEDNAGNTTNCPAAVAGVYVDTTAPTCPTPTGQNTSWRNTTITVSYGCNDAHSGCNSNYSGGSKTYSTGTTFTDTITYTIRDNVGNEATCKPTVNVYADFEKPGCTSSGGNAAWTNGSRTLTGTCDAKGGSPCTANATKTYSSEINSSTESPGVVYDAAGNSITCPGNQTVKIDKTAPKCTSSGGSASWTNGSRTLIGTCSEQGTYKSGCSGNVSKKYDSEGNWTKQSPGTVSDAAGNTANCPADQTVRIDRTAPNCASSGGTATWTNGKRTLTGTCTETGTYKSGCKGNVTKDYDTEGAWTSQSPGRVYDNAGNYKDCPADQTIRIDRTAPTCTSSGGSTSWTKNAVTITGTCTEQGTYKSGCSGNASKKYDSEGNWTSQSPGTVSDAAGNTANCPADQTIRIDRTAPKCTNSGGTGNGWTKNAVTITGTCTEQGTYKSGCSGNASKKYDSEGVWTNQSPGRVYDAAGNYVDCQANQTVRIDRTAPDCTSSGGSASWTNGSRTLTGTCKDKGTYQSGCTGDVSKKYDSEGNWTKQSPGTVSDAAGNTTTCPGNQTVRIDKTNPTCTITKSNTGLTTGLTATAVCKDTGGSGCSNTSSSNLKANTTLTVTDGAGNKGTCTATVTAQSQYSNCTAYNSCANSACGVQNYNTCANAACGVAEYNSCTHSSCGVNLYKSCQDSACGVNQYKSCVNNNCSCKTSRTVYDCPSTHPNGGGTSSTCYKVVNYSDNPNYSCNSGDSRNGTTCTHTVAANKVVTPYCDSGYTLNSSKTSCYKQVGDASWSCHAYSNMTVRVSDVCYYCLPGDSPTGTTKCTRKSGNTTIAVSPQSGLASYTCPSGQWVCNTSKCCSTGTLRSSTTYNCNNIGGTVSGTNCVSTYNATASCSRGTLSNGKCVGSYNENTTGTARTECTERNSCRDASCGVESYKSCRLEKCGVESYKSCPNSTCTPKSYKSCETSGCGIKSYKSCATIGCGCSTWGGWTNGSCTAAANSKQCRTVYN